MGKRPKQQVVTNEPPKFLTPHFQNIAGEAENLFRNNQGFSSEEEEAFQRITDRARAGGLGIGSAIDQNEATLRGDFLHGGPGFDAAFQAASNRIVPQVQSGFARAGRLGSGLARQAETQALSDAFANLHGQERQRQLAATQLAPGLAGFENAQDFFDAAQLQEVGQLRRDLPFVNLQRYLSSVAPLASGFGQQSQPLHQNRLGQLAGGALLGYTLGGPVGGVLGGLGGLL